MRTFIVILVLLSAFELSSQGARNYTVPVSAAVQKSPPQIKLNWSFQAGVTSYQVFRKLKSETSWDHLFLA